MSYTMEDFTKDFVREHLYLLSPEERLKGIPVEVALKGIPLEERLKWVPVEVALKGIPREEIEEYLSKLKEK
ncbi:hypothetical protein QUF54_09650 [Candidatus Marithioploca araucensis]|uniref:Uncharacterized protein n=1 Tax=Candidatus Marithioploca araucensis TaxID=70273 RepID=A0ABT7VVS3_9GAMM|nr:hypothetical protein [Candidatus Marithioploca araucensis]